MENNQRNNFIESPDETEANHAYAREVEKLEHKLMYGTEEEGYVTITSPLTGVTLKYIIPDHIPVDPSWTILGNIELEEWDLAGDPFMNVLAHKVDKQGIHNYAIGWEPMAPIARETCPGWGFEDGFYLHSVEYIPIAYVIGLLVGLKEHKGHPLHPEYQQANMVHYTIDYRKFAIKPRWRFRGSKTWIPMEPDWVITDVLKDLDRRFIRQRLFEKNFDLQAIGWFHELSDRLYISKDMPRKDLESMVAAAWLMIPPAGKLHISMLGNEERGQIPPNCTILLLFNTDPENIVAIQANAKPRHMTWAKIIEIVRLTRVWPVNEESMFGPTFPLKVINIKTNSVNNL